MAEEKLSENMEDYLEVILALAGNKGVARVGAIAGKMDVKSPSVNAALKGLSERGLVEHEKYGYVTLTQKGQGIAAEVQEKHDVLFRFLTEVLMLDPKVAGDEACSIEHAIGRETFARLVTFIGFLEAPSSGKRSELLKKFQEHLKAASSGKARAGLTMLELNNAEVFTVKRVTIAREIGKRLADMGFVQGATGRVVRSALWGDPIQVKICGYDVAIRRSEAAGIEIERMV